MSEELEKLRIIAKDVTAHWLSGDDLTNDELEDLWIASELNEDQFAILVRGRLHQILETSWLLLANDTVIGHSR